MTVCSPDTSTWTCRVHGSQWLVIENLCRTQVVLAEIGLERQRQFAQYGSNSDLDDGTGPAVNWLAGVSPLPADALEALVRVEYVDHERKHGKPTWMHLVREEVAEAFKEEDPMRLREELVQVAALCASWAEKLDERTWS